MLKKGLLASLTMLMVLLPLLPARAQGKVTIHPWLTDVEYSLPIEDAIVRNGRTFVPIRELGNSLGCKVDYNKGKIIVLKNGLKIEFTVNKKEAVVNGQKTTIDEEPILINGKCYLPLRFIADNLNLNLKYYYFKESKRSFILLADHTLLSDEEVAYELKHNFVLDPFEDFWLDSYNLKEGKKTKRGIGIGNTVEELLKAYGKPAKIEQLEDGIEVYYYASYFYLESEFSGLAIYTKDGIVTRVSLTD